ncbi:hypothetical protein [Williamsia sp. M5A3_1d]
MVSVVLFVMFAVLLTFMVLQWRRGRAGGSGGLFGGGGVGAGLVQGTLTVTGVSDRPDEGDRNDQMYCTVSGTIIGPDTAPTNVYGHMVVTGKTPWPQIGADMPVVYKPGKTDTSWRFGSLEIPPAA